MDPTTIVDLVRFATLTMGTIILFTTLKVIYNYSKAAWRALRAGEWIGILPMHVYLIAISYSILIGTSMSMIIERIGKPASPFLPIHAVSFTCGIIALRLILNFEERRVQRGRLEDEAENAILRQTIERMAAELGLVETEQEKKRKGK